MKKLFTLILALLLTLTCAPAFAQTIGARVTVDREQARDLIGKIDNARENYIKRYTGTSRYDARNYDLVLSADGHSEEQLADIILSYIQ